jgi:hypothetical protein
MDCDWGYEYENPRAVPTEKASYFNIKYLQLKMLHHHGKAIFLVTVHGTFDLVTNALMLPSTSSRGNSS